MIGKIPGLTIFILQALCIVAITLAPKHHRHSGAGVALGLEGTHAGCPTMHLRMVVRSVCTE